MIPFILRRLSVAVPTLLVMTVAVFFLLRLAPGGPFDSERSFPPEIQRAIEEKYGLHEPVLMQYWRWISGALRGDLNESFQYLGQPVAELISSSLPTSFWLGLLSLAFSIVLGIPLGALAAWKRNTWWDTSAMFLAIAGVSLPSYLVASILVLIFSMGLGWFPPALWESWDAMVLPVITLGFRPMAMIARMTRASLLEALTSDYVRTAYAKGLESRVVVFKHAMKNSMVPVLTILGPISANLVTGSFLVEMVFQIPGMGKHFVSAVTNRDYPLVMGVTLVYGVILILSNLVVDLMYGLVDPRIRQ
ncbi:MAG: ABC transporter permease [Bdellovibrionales bacterium]|nr:ABC transporter permease [Bdellovibrionales bacterium]